MAAVLVTVIAGTGASMGHLSERVNGNQAASSPVASSPRMDSGTRSEKCHARKGLRFYVRRYGEHAARMGAAVPSRRALQAAMNSDRPGRCPLYLANVWKRKAFAMRQRYERWRHYHYAWSTWLPAKWQRIGACETGYGRRPGRWDWNSGTYQGAFGFYHGSWDAFVPRADRKAGPYPSEAYNATPRQQYEVALAIWRAYGFSGWGCRGA